MNCYNTRLEYGNAFLYLMIFYKNLWIDINYVYFLFSCNEELIFMLFVLKSMYLRKISQKIQLILSQENKEHRWLYRSNVTYMHMIRMIGSEKNISKCYI